MNRIYCGLAPKIVGIGIAVLDHLAVVDPFPQVDEKMEALDSLVQGGGPVATALCAASKLGIKCALQSVLGDDFAASKVIEELRDFGVLTPGIIVDPLVETPHATILIEKTSGRRSVILSKLRSRYLAPDEINFDEIAQARVLLVDGREPDTTLQALKYAKSINVTTVMDAGSVRSGFEEYAEYLDYLICSLSFARAFTGEHDPEKALPKLSSRLVGKVAVTLGEGGVMTMDGGEIHRIPAFTVEVVDTTGAGDVFHGSFCACLAGLNPDLTFLEQLKFAAAAAAISCKHIGGRGQLPTMDQITFLMQNEK